MKNIENYFSDILTQDEMYFLKESFECDLLTELEKSKVLTAKNINTIMRILERDIDIADYIMVSANGNSIALYEDGLKHNLDEALEDDVYSLKFVIMYFINMAFDVDYKE